MPVQDAHREAAGPPPHHTWMAQAAGLRGSAGDKDGCKGTSGGQTPTSKCRVMLLGTRVAAAEMARNGHFFLGKKIECQGLEKEDDFEGGSLSKRKNTVPFTEMRQGGTGEAGAGGQGVERPG